MNNLFDVVRDAFLCENVDEKLKKTHQMVLAWKQGELEIGDFGKAADVRQVGLPRQPERVLASKVPKRKLGTPEGRAVMMHAIAHIEFNAINLSLDAVQRFERMPKQFYEDWLKVAGEEAYHFELIRTHLRQLGSDYGDFPAHGGLWEMCEKTEHDVLIRMALVPRVLEARGLDVTPGIQKKLAQAGDDNAVSLLDIILRDEIGHVEIGNRWFRHCCSARGLEPDTTFFNLLDEFYPKGLMGPFNLEARARAGFSQQEIDVLMR